MNSDVSSRSIYYKLYVMMSNIESFEDVGFNRVCIPTGTTWLQHFFIPYSNKDKLCSESKGVKILSLSHVLT